MNPRLLLGGAGALAVAAVAVALVSQHVFDMQPCAWCTFQRLLFLVFALLAFAGASGRGTRAWAALAGLDAAGGLAAALWQHFVASASQSCAMTLADRVVKGASLDELAPWLFKATAFCDEANVPLAGIPYALWSAALFAVLLLVAAAALRGRRGA